MGLFLLNQKERRLGPLAEERGLGPLAEAYKEIVGNPDLPENRIPTELYEDATAKGSFCTGATTPRSRRKSLETLPTPRLPCERRVGKGHRCIVEVQVPGDGEATSTFAGAA